MSMNNTLVVLKRRISDWTLVTRLRVLHVRVVRWEDSSSGSHDGAEILIEFLGFFLLDGLLEDGAGGGVGAGLALWDGDGGVFVEAWVVVCGCFAGSGLV